MIAPGADAFPNEVRRLLLTIMGRVASTSPETFSLPGLVASAVRA